MKDSIKKYFKMGLVQWMSFPPARYDIVSSVYNVACDPFFDAIEMTSLPDDETRSKIKAILQTAHMEFCYGAQPCLLKAGANPNHLDEDERMRAEQILIQAIDEAEMMGSKGIAFLAGKWQEATREEAYQQLLKTTRHICEYAATKNMQIVLSVFDYDMDKEALIGPAPLAARFAADVRCYCSNFGLMVDLSHIPTTHETPKFVVQVLRPYIVHLHIGNAVVTPGLPAYGDKHPCFGFPGSVHDTDELTDFFRLLKREGFFNEQAPFNLSFEVAPFEDEDAYLVIAGTKRVIERAWAMLED